MTIGTKTGLFFLAGDGLADATIKFTGTLAQTNIALKSLSYISALDALVATNITISTQRDAYIPRVAIPLAVAENRVLRITDPALPGKISVVIHGTSYNDTITVQSASNLTANYTVTVNGATTPMLGITGRFIVYGLDGNDYIDLTASKVAVRVDGGRGNDVILGGTVADVLFGADGADFIAGGLGAETIDGGSGNDILVDGSASVRTVGKTLRSILDGWALLPSPALSDYAAITSDIVFTADKQSKDTLRGGIGNDWFWSAVVQNSGVVADILDTPTEKRRTS
jgi:Ca2+-binding RTX toxin-like protein